MTQHIKKILLLAVLTLFIFLISLDVSSIITKQYMFITPVVWFFVDFCLLAVAIYTFWNLLINLNRYKMIWTALTIAVFIGLIIINLGRAQNLSGETTQEVNCALEAITKSIDGLHQACFLGYPIRQYTMMGWPTLALGRSLISLNLGGSLYFLIGLILFCAGGVKYLAHTRHGDIAIAIVLTVLFHVHYFNHFLFYFEQSIFPLSFGLMIVGMLLDYLSSQRVKPLILIIPVLLHTVYSYTPSVALLGLVCVVLLYLILRRGVVNRGQKLILTLILVGIIVLFWFTLHYRHDINIISEKQKNSQIISDLQSGFYQIFFPENVYKSYISPVVVFPLIGVTLLMLFGIFGWQVMTVSVWIILTITFAIVSRGYTDYAIEFRLHRSMVIFPVLMGLVLSIFKKFHTTDRKILFVVYLFMLVSGIWYHLIILSIRNPNPHYLIVNAMNEIKNEQSKKIDEPTVYFLDNDSGSFRSFADTGTYFYPTLQQAYYKATEEIFPTCVPVKLSAYIILQSSNKCFAKIKQLIRMNDEWYYRIVEIANDGNYLVMTPKI